LNQLMNKILNRLSLGAKLWLAPGCTIALLLVFAAGGYVAMRQQQSVITQIVEVRNPSLFFMVDLERQVKQVNSSTYQLLSWSTASYSAEQTTKLAKSILASLPPIQKATASLAGRPGLTELEATTAKRIVESIDNFLKQIPQVIEMVDVDQSVATTMMIKTVAPFNALAKDIESLRTVQQNQMVETNAASQRYTSALVARGLVSLGIGCALAVLVVWAVRRSILRSVGAISDAAAALKEGDLTARVALTTQDEIAAVGQGFNNMAESLDAMIQTIREKTAAVQAMLVNIPQGILTVVHGNTIHPEYSAYLEKMFEQDDIAGKEVMELVFSNTNIGSDMLSQIDAALSACIGEDNMNFEFNSHLFITEFDKHFADGRTKSLEVSWSPICNEHDVVEKLMLCVRDVTQLKLLAAEAAQQKRELDIIGQILAINQEKFHAFVDSASAFISENEQLIDGVGTQATQPVDKEIIAQLFRNMHTVKGNARTYGFMHLTNLVHEAEQMYDDLRNQPEMVWDQLLLTQQLTAVRDGIAEYARINEVKLGRKGPGRRGSIEKFLMVEKEHVDRAIAALRRVDCNDTASMVTVIRAVRNSLELIGTDTLCSILAGARDSLPSLARELGKEPPALTINDQGIAIANQIADLLRNVFMHLLRNSIDHGIQAPAIRIAQGMPAAGQIWIDVALGDGTLKLTLRDDGAGLGVRAIRQKAVAMGIIADDAVISHEEIAQLIFAPGFSTAAAVTEVSGRGVGMDAVKSFVEREGGTIALVLNASATGAEFRTFETVIRLPGRFAVSREG
jgi:two-component system chemotaxis sensor kinase CheA